MDAYRIVAVAAALGWVGGCSRANPAFGDDPTAGLETGAVTTDPGTTDDPTTVPPGTSGDTTPGTADGTGTGNPGTTGPDPMTTGASMTEGTTGEPICPQHDDSPIEIAVFEPLGGMVPVPVGCDQVIQRGTGMLSVVGNTIHHQVCGSCKCAKEPGAIIDFGDTLTPPPLPECGQIAVWPGMTSDGTCGWVGMAVFPTVTNEIPIYLATNGRELPQTIFGAVPVGLSPDAICDAGPVCAQTPGRYALAFENGDTVSVGAPDIATIGFFAGVDMEVTNRMSSIDLECHERVAWTARDPG